MPSSATPATRRPAATSNVTAFASPPVTRTAVLALEGPYPDRRAHNRAGARLNISLWRLCDAPYRPPAVTGEAWVWPKGSCQGILPVAASKQYISLPASPTVRKKRSTAMGEGT